MTTNLRGRVAQRATGNRQANKELVVKAKVRDVRQLFEKMKPQFEMALPRHVTVDRFLRVALTAVQKTPKLLDCTPESLLAALLESARLGLEPGTKQAAIVPYGKQATFIAQWQGLVELMYRSGQVTNVTAEFIHENDEWSYRIGDGGGFWHEPDLLAPAEERGPILLVYAYAEIKGGGRSKIVTLNRWQAVEIRDRYSKAYALAEQHRREDPEDFALNPAKGWFNSTWHTEFDAMWRKSAVRRLADWVPQSPELVELLSRENEAGESELPDFDFEGEVVGESEEPETPADVPPGQTAEEPARPAPDYVCERCQAVGQHFEDECPGAAS
ncbi:recombinase RecT [Streptosporangium sp. NPDC020145]|uniref:recombinase RecT n=1 Tax=Streptosporangium sp. NPDC020145 TaxID=3154694 RepID=UPI003418336B